MEYGEEDSYHPGIDALSAILGPLHHPPPPRSTPAAVRRVYFEFAATKDGTSKPWLQKTKSVSGEEGWQRPRCNRIRMSHEEEDTCMSCEEEDTCRSKVVSYTRIRMFEYVLQMTV